MGGACQTSFSLSDCGIIVRVSPPAPCIARLASTGSPDLPYFTKLHLPFWSSRLFLGLDVNASANWRQGGFASITTRPPASSLLITCD